MGATLRFLRAYGRLSFRTLLEYRVSFLAQVLAMTLNNGLWMVFWVLYFERFPVVKGWTLTDLLTLWAVTCTSIGLVWGFFQNALTIPDLAWRGGLDYYLVMPRPVLLHLSISRVSLFNVTDALFGLTLFLVGCPFSLSRLGAFLLVVGLASLIWYAFMVLVGSLCFFLGTAQGFADEIRLFLTHFCTYPGDLFGPRTRLVLMTLLPALLVSSIPVDFVREPRWDTLLVMCAGGAIFWGLAVVLFHLGLRRYESGSSLGMRG